MNLLKHFDNGILSSQNDAKSLAEKDSAKILVISDSHGNFTLFRTIVLRYGATCDALFFAGDGINDLAKILCEAHSENHFLQSMPPLIAFVKGNNDYQNVKVNFDLYNYKTNNANNEEDEYEENHYLLHIPRTSIVEIARKKIMITHGNEHGVYYSTSTLIQAAKNYNANAVVFGHTHCPFEMNSQIYQLNPGSISYPRNLSKPTFAFLNITQKEIYSTFFKVQKTPKLDFIPYNPQIMS